MDGGSREQPLPSHQPHSTSGHLQGLDGHHVCCRGPGRWVGAEMWLVSEPGRGLGSIPTHAASSGSPRNPAAYRGG